MLNDVVLNARATCDAAGSLTRVRATVAVDVVMGRRAAGAGRGAKRGGQGGGRLNFGSLEEVMEVGAVQRRAAAAMRGG